MGGNSKGQREALNKGQTVCRKMDLSEFKLQVDAVETALREQAKEYHDAQMAKHGETQAHLSHVSEQLSEQLSAIQGELADMRKPKCRWGKHCLRKGKGCRFAHY